MKRGFRVFLRENCPTPRHPKEWCPTCSGIMSMATFYLEAFWVFLVMLFLYFNFISEKASKTNSSIKIGKFYCIFIQKRIIYSETLESRVHFAQILMRDRKIKRDRSIWSRKAKDIRFNWWGEIRKWWSKTHFCSCVGLFRCPRSAPLGKTCLFVTAFK